MQGSDPAITRLLQSWRTGDESAANQLVTVVYDQLRRLAASHLRNERPGHTLAATALVHEAYLKIAGGGIDFHDRSHFFAVASTAMRRVLVDHARHNKRQRRGGDAIRADFDQALLLTGQSDALILDIDEALSQLASMDPRKGSIFEMTYFGGLSSAEMSEALGISEATIKRDLRLARAWMKNQLNPGGNSAATAANGRE